MQCPESLRVQAHFDAEVDALSGADIERHLEHCVECRELRANLDQVRGGLRLEGQSLQAPPALRRRVLRALDAADARGRASQRPVDHALWRRRSFWLGAASALATAAAAASVAFFIMTSPFRSPLVDAVLGAHVSSLMSSHLIEVLSTDQHTVKPWFAGRVEVSPAVADFTAQGYVLAGGRIDYLEHQRAAVVVYRHGRHIINVFCWAAPQGLLPRNVTRHGYHLSFWKSGDLAYAAVSDTGWDELQSLERLLRE